LAGLEKDENVMADAVGPLEHLLAEIPAGRRVRITGHRGGRMLRARLLAMGLNLGREVEVLQNNRGLIIVGVNGGRVALGRGGFRRVGAAGVSSSRDRLTWLNAARYWSYPGVNRQPDPGLGSARHDGWPDGELSGGTFGFSGSRT